MFIRDEELRILRTRIAGLPPNKRPHYPPERFAILMLRARTGWSAAEVGRRFLVTSTTVAPSSPPVPSRG